MTNEVTRAVRNVMMLIPWDVWAEPSTLEVVAADDDDVEVVDMMMM